MSETCFKLYYEDERAYIIAVIKGMIGVNNKYLINITNQSDKTEKCVRITKSQLKEMVGTLQNAIEVMKDE